MSSSILQGEAIVELQAMRAESARVLQSFINGFDASIQRLANYETNVMPPAGFGPEDLAIIAAAKADMLDASTTALSDRLTILQNIE